MSDYGDSTSLTTWNLGTGTYAGSVSSGYTMSFTTPSDTGVRVALGRQKGTSEIGATLYLKFVKSKLARVNQERVKRRLAKLKDLIAYSKEMGQRALYESLCEEIAVLVRESEMVSFGIVQYVDFEWINKYLDKVRDKNIQWLPLEKFPRVIPTEVQKKIKQVEKAEVFDELWVLFLDYTKTEMKTTKEKIKNKDPILFGRFMHQPDRYYFIADWVDEYCDLTFTKFVNAFKNDTTFSVPKVEPIDEARWKGIVDEVKARHKRLAETKPDNWRELEKAEANAETTKLKEITSEEAEDLQRSLHAEADEALLNRVLGPESGERKWWKFWS